MIVMTVNRAVEACMVVAGSTETTDPAASHDDLRAAIVRNLSELKIDADDLQVELP